MKISEADAMSGMDRIPEGVYIQASTRESLEALYEFLKTQSIPVSGFGIGPVDEDDVLKASLMIEINKIEYSAILAFDVQVTPEARKLADEFRVKIFVADTICHLCDQFKAHIDDFEKLKEKEAAEAAVFPCVLRIRPNCVFNTLDPVILGVVVTDGILKIGTPLCFPKMVRIDVGRVSSIENNNMPVSYAKKGQKVTIKLTGHCAEEKQKIFREYFETQYELVSHILKKSIDRLKAYYQDELTNEEWMLLDKLKYFFEI